MSDNVDNQSKSEVHQVTDTESAAAKRAEFRIPADIGVAARTFDKYSELAHAASIGEEARVKTIEDVHHKLQNGGKATSEFLFADIALSVLPDNLVTPAISEVRERFKQNQDHGLMNAAILIEQSADKQPDHILFQKPILNDESPVEKAIHTNTKARAAVLQAVLKQEASIYAIAREFNQSTSTEDFGKGISPAIVSAYESACKIVDDNPDLYVLAGALSTLELQTNSKMIKQEVLQQTGRRKYVGITMSPQITSKDFKRS